MCNDTEKRQHRSKDLGQEEQMSKLEENWVIVDSKLPRMQTTARTAKSKRLNTSPTILISQCSHSINQINQAGKLLIDLPFLWWREVWYQSCANRGYKNRHQTKIAELKDGSVLIYSESIKKRKQSTRSWEIRGRTRGTWIPWFLFKQSII